MRHRSGRGYVAVTCTATLLGVVLASEHKAFLVPSAPLAPRQRLGAGAAGFGPPPARTALCSLAGELLLVSGYITTDVGVFMYTDLAGTGFARPALMFISAVTSFVVGTGVSWLRNRESGLRDSVLPKNWVPLLPVSALFCVATWCTLQAVSMLSPVCVKVLLQLKLPVMVALSMLFLQRSYTSLQLQALANVFLAATAFTALRVGDSFAMATTNAASVGVALALVTVFCNVLATLIAEKRLKSSGLPFHTIVAHVKIGEALIAFATLCLVPGAELPLARLLQNPSSMLAGFSAPVWMLALILVCDGWTSALVVKQLSSVVKAIAKCLSLIVLYLVSLLILQRETFSVVQFILAVLVASGTQQFAYASTLKKREDARLKRPQSDAQSKRIEEVFRKHADGSQGVDLSVIPHMCSELGTKMSDNKLKAEVEQMGWDDHVSLEEFASFFASTPGLGGYRQMTKQALRLRLGWIGSR